MSRKEKPIASIRQSEAQAPEVFTSDTFHTYDRSRDLGLPPETVGRLPLEGMIVTDGLSFPAAECFFPTAPLRAPHCGKCGTEETKVICACCGRERLTPAG